MHKLLIPEREGLGIELFDPEMNLIGIVNDTMQLYDIRCQIKDLHIKDRTVYHYFKLNDKLFKIDIHGRLERAAKSVVEMHIYETYLNRLLQ